MHVRFWHLRKRHSQCPVQQTEYLGLKQYLPAKQWALPKLPRLQLHSKNVADSICFLQPSLLAHLRVLCVCLTILALDMFLILVVGLSNGLPIVQVLFIFFFICFLYMSLLICLILHRCIVHYVRRKESRKMLLYDNL